MRGMKIKSESEKVNSIELERDLSLSLSYSIEFVEFLQHIIVSWKALI